MKTQQRWSQGSTADDPTTETRLLIWLHHRHQTLIVWAGISCTVLIGSTILWLL